MVYRMTKIISPSCMQLKIVRIHLPLMICVLVDKHYGIGGILLCYPTRRRPILSMLFRCAIAIGLGLPLSLYPGSLLQSDGTPGKFLNQFPLSCCRNMQLKKRKASILVKH